MNEIPWSGLEALALVVQSGSFRAAAKELGVSPSALSHRVRALEETLQLRVLNRTTRSHALTPAGQALLEHFAPARQEVLATLDGLHEHALRVRGTLRLNAPPLASRQVLPPVIADLTTRHPAIRVEIVSEGALVDIVQGGFDAGVRFPSQLPADMLARAIGPPQRFVVVGTHAYLEHHGVPQHPSDLHDHRCIALRFPSGQRFDWEFFEDPRWFQIRVNPVATVQESLEGLALARRGVGLAFCAASDAAPDLAAGRLRTVLDPWRPEEPGFRLYYPSRRLQRAPLRALLAVLTE